MTSRHGTTPLAGYLDHDRLPTPSSGRAHAWADKAVEWIGEATGDDLDGRIAAISVRANEAGHDPFGFDPEASRYALAVAALLHRRYFRTIVEGIRHVPRGRVLLIANHSGQLPVDGLLLGTSLMLDADPPRFPRSMVEKWTAELPYVSYLFPRLGQVVGAPENARRLLDDEQAIIVFPEGVRGISKPFSKRYQLEDFGLGFMRLALETGTPIVPVGIVGGEEQYPAIADIKPLAKLLGMPSFPILPQLLFGMIAPLPVRYRLHFGTPLRFEGDADDDDAVIEDMVDKVKSSVAALISKGLAERDGIFR